MLEKMTQVAQETGQLENVRGIGALVAADLIPQPGRLRLGYEVYQEAVKQGVLLRPIGNTLYWLPPLNIDFDLIEVLQKVTKNAIKILSLGF